MVRETYLSSTMKAVILGGFKALVIALFILAIPVALITTNIRVAVSEEAVYDYSVREFGAAEASGIPEAELVRANGEIKRYLTSGDAGSLSIRVQTERDATVPLFSARETAHMADVRALVQNAFAVQIASVLAVLTLAVMIISMWPVRVLATGALCGSVLTVAVLGTAGIIAASGFDSAWTEFHVVAFSNDLWQLDPSRDHLIQMFPEEFWFEVTTLIVAATVMQAVVIGAVAAGYILLARDRQAPYLLLAPAVASPTGQPQPNVASSTARPYVR
jgi:integral membrane protein (TIGR01906 family)